MEFHYFAVTVLLFSGFRPLTATPLCTFEELEKFSMPTPPSIQATTEEELGNFCREVGPSLNGLVNYLRQCRNTEVGKGLPLYESTKELFDGLCTPENPLRQKFLDNIKCLTVDNDLNDGCGEVVQPLMNYQEGSPCSTGFIGMGCMQKNAFDKCGSDGLYVMKAMAKPGYQVIESACCQNQGNEHHSNFEAHLLH